MNKLRELKTDSTLWTTPAKITNLLDFKPEKLSTETVSNTNNDMKVHKVRYKNGGFYLTIDNINRENGELKLHKNIRLFYNDLPIKHMFKIPSITIVIKSLIEKNNTFYLELSINRC